MAHLGARLDYVGQSCRHLEATVRLQYWRKCFSGSVLLRKMHIAKNLVKRNENGPQMAPRWCEDGAMLAHVGALGRYLGPSWRSRAPSCRQVVAR